MMGFAPLGFLPLGFVLFPFSALANGGSIVVTYPGAGIAAAIGGGGISADFQSGSTLTPNQGAIHVSALQPRMTVTNA